jgi:hypothetical protein
MEMDELPSEVPHTHRETANAGQQSGNEPRQGLSRVGTTREEMKALNRLQQVVETAMKKVVTRRKEVAKVAMRVVVTVVGEVAGAVKGADRRGPKGNSIRRRQRWANSGRNEPGGE